MGDETDNRFGPAMEELGIDPGVLEASDLDLGDEVISMEASDESEQGEKLNETEEEEDDSAEDTTLEDGEEKATQEEAPATEEVVEEPKTAKELEEISAQKAAFEAEKTAFMEERQKIETEFVQQHAEKLKAHDELDAFLSHLSGKDPELFGLLQDEFKEHSRAYSNPVFDQLKKQQEDTAKQLQEIKQRFSDDSTRVKYESELNQVKSTIGKEAEELGLKPDWKLIEDVWADNPKLSLTEAFHAKYGASIAKAAASKAKVQAVESKAKSRPVVATSGQARRSTATIAPDFSKMSIDDTVKYFARNVK